MVNFDARVAGTPAAAWDDARLRLAPPLEMSGYSELIVFAAHADDETLGAGGLIAAASRGGIPVRVVVVTDGAASIVAGIADRRSAELADALAVLAPGARVTELGFADSETPDHRERIGAEIAAIIDAAPADALLVSTWAGDGHRDHRVVGELVAELAGGRHVVAYPIWMWHWADPSNPDLPWNDFRTLPIDAALKSRAIDAYPSQTEGAEPTLRADMLEHFTLGREIFIEVHAIDEHGEHDDSSGHDDTPRLDADYFDDLHTRRDDPWRFLTRWYEERKRAITVASLPRSRYAQALEVGCSIGVLTAELAGRSDDLLAVDVSAAAVENAKRRVGGAARVELRDVSDGFPSGPFDLIVLSEVGYYFSADRIDGVLEAARDALSPTGELIACHWRHPVDDYPLLGDEVHARIAKLGLPRLVRHEEADFLLEVFSRDPRSVGEREGLA